MITYKIVKTSNKTLVKNAMFKKVWVEHDLHYDAYRKGKIFGFWHDIMLRANNIEDIKNNISMYNEVYYNNEEYEIIGG